MNRLEQLKIADDPCASSEDLQRLRDSLSGKSELIEAATWTPFPLEVLPRSLRELAAQGARAYGCDPSAIALPGLVVYAGAIGHTYCVEPKRTWLEPAILWGAVVVESGATKSPGYYLAVDPADEWQNEQFQEYQAAYERYEGELERYKDSKHARGGRNRSLDLSPPAERPTEPAEARLVIKDVTLESVAKVLVENERGLLLCREELSAWFGSHNAYSSGKKDGGGWIEMYGAKALDVDRKTQKRIHVSKALVSIIGTIQPEILRQHLGEDALHSGLAARFFFAKPPFKVEEWTEDELSDSVVNAYREAFRRLIALRPSMDEHGRPVSRVIRFDARALEEFKAYHNELMSRVAELPDSAERKALVKLKGGCARLALVLHLAEWADGSSPVPTETVDVATMENAIALSWWFAGQAQRVYQFLSETAGQRRARELLDWIAVRGRRVPHGRAVTARDVQVGNRRYKGKTKQTKAELEALASAGILKREHTGGPGRHTTLYVLPDRVSSLHNSLNPQNGDGFEDTAGQNGTGESE